MGNQHSGKPHSNANDGQSSPSSAHSEPTRTWFEYRAELKELWKNRDKNGNGRLDPSEVKLLVEDGVKALGKGIANDTKKTAEIVDEFVNDLDVDQNGKVEFSDFEKTVKKFLAKTESNATNWLIDGLNDFENEMRTSINQFEARLKAHIREAIIEAAKSDNGLLDELIPIFVAKIKKKLAEDPDVVAALKCIHSDYEWLEEKFKAFDKNVKPIEETIDNYRNWILENRVLLYGILGLAVILPYLAIIKFLFF